MTHSKIPPSALLNIAARVRRSHVVRMSCTSRFFVPPATPKCVRNFFFMYPTFLCKLRPYIKIKIQLTVNNFSSLITSQNSFVFVDSNHLISVTGDRGGTVLTVPCYKSEGRWFFSQLVSVDFSLT